MSTVRISEIWIYPIKSMGGIQLTKSKVMEKGLEYDRRLMLVDESGKFMTQRTTPEMALFKLSMVDGFIIVQYKINPDSLRVPFGSYQPTPTRVSIWDDSVEANEVSPESSKWFSDKLNRKCKLVFFPEGNKRPVDSNYASGNEQVSLADGYPYLIIGQATLEELNSRLKEPIPINRFRPNFVFTGSKAYEEDSWKNFSIGTNRFTGVKNCSRCVLITVDQETGKKGVEPLQTLSTYRKRGSNVYLGQNLLAVDHEQVAVGDVITFGH